MDYHGGSNLLSAICVCVGSHNLIIIWRSILSRTPKCLQTAVLQNSIPSSNCNAVDHTSLHYTRVGTTLRTNYASPGACEAAQECQTAHLKYLPAMTLIHNSQHILQDNSQMRSATARAAGQLCDVTVHCRHVLGSAGMTVRSFGTFE